MTKTIDAEAADRAAAAARDAVDQAEQAITSGRRLGVDKLTALVTRARHADLTAKASRAQAEQDREQARREALTGVAAEIDALAEAGVEGLGDALADVAAAAERARQAARAWDARLTEVTGAASALSCRAPAPGGPREADERVAIRDDGTIYHGETVLKRLGSRIDAALGNALNGDVVSATASAEVTAKARTLERADHYVRGRGGMILPIYGDLNQNQQAQIRTGQLVELNEREIRAYLAGDL